MFWFRYSYDSINNLPLLTGGLGQKESKKKRKEKGMIILFFTDLTPFLNKNVLVYSGFGWMVMLSKKYDPYRHTAWKASEYDQEYQNHTLQKQSNQINTL